MAGYRLVGGASLPKPRNPRKGQGIDTAFRHGTTRAAMSTTTTERTLGASIRQGWRLSCGAVERAAHDARATVNDAAYYAHPAPMSYTTTTQVDAIGPESITPKSNLLPVRFEHRLDHLARGERLPTPARTVDNTVYSVTVRTPGE